MIWLLSGTLISSLAGIALFVYYLREGQFDDLEDVKYQMFRSDDHPKR